MITTPTIEHDASLHRAGYDRLRIGPGRYFQEAAKAALREGPLTTDSRTRAAIRARTGKPAPMGAGQFGFEIEDVHILFRPPPKRLTEEAWKASRHYREDISWEELSDPSPSGERMVTEPYAALVHDARKEEARRRDILRRGPGGFWGGATRLSGALTGALLDPVNLTMMFMPVVREARYARMMAGMGKPLARTTRGAAEGATFMALTEPLVLRAAELEQADYTALDSLQNIAFGAAFGGALRAGGGALLDAGRAIAPRLRGQHFRAAVQDVAEGRRMDADTDMIARTRPEGEIPRGEIPRDRAPDTARNEIPEGETPRNGAPDTKRAEDPMARDAREEGDDLKREIMGRLDPEDARTLREADAFVERTTHYGEALRLAARCATGRMP
uniref:Uncharacterized protein n=1 Tax=Candidatus Kentrum sp. LPFa TaxID=2126335 RepID=A0A450W4Q4_9GAMM|nr:MAG: hypothetical protein BECKLPF1236B_GA0070989_10293 [Candidatus Kentron sp. LPFa]